MGSHHNLHVLIQRHQKTQQALDRELPELSAQHLGDIGLADSKQLGGRCLREAALFQDGVNLENQVRFDQMLLQRQVCQGLETRCRFPLCTALCRSLPSPAADLFGRYSIMLISL